MKSTRRVISLVVACLLLTAVLPFSLAEEILIMPVTISLTDANYSQDFENDADTWMGRGDGVVVERSQEIKHSGSYSLKVSGRKLHWNGPGRSFNLTSDKLYEASVWVYAAREYAMYMLSAEITSADGSQKYTNLGQAFTMESGWLNISATFSVPEEHAGFVLYLETPSLAQYGFADIPDDTEDFYIDDFTVKERVLVDPAGLPDLKEAYEGIFDIGAALSLSSVSSETIRNFVARQFSIFTHENELKPDNVFDQAGSKARFSEGVNDDPAVKFDAAKPGLDFARENGLKVHGHTLLWHSQTPRALFTVDYSTDGELADRELMLKRMENYIKNVMEYMKTNYSGVIVSWDVVNEAIDDSGKPRGLGVTEEPASQPPLWYMTVGADYIEKAFEFARKYAEEGTELYYNDYSVPNNPKRTGIIEAITPIVEAGNIDGMGLQGHYDMNWPSSSQLDETICDFVELGLKIKISELDITANGRDEASFNAQGERFRELFALFVRYSDYIDGVTVWGVTDDTSWKSYGSPLLFEAGLQPKPAFWSVLALRGVYADEQQPSSWAADVVAQAAKDGLLPEYLQGEYTSAMTREEFCDMTAAFIGAATGTSIQDFAEAKGLSAVEDTFYDTRSANVLYANALGIVNGKGAGRFDPAGYIKREEAAAMLYRLAQVVGFEGTGGEPVSFPDKDSFSDYSVDAIAFVSACIDPVSGSKLMGGIASGAFSPAGTYTREQSAATFVRLLNMMVAASEEAAA